MYKRQVDYQVYYPELVTLDDSPLSESYEILNERLQENALGDYYIDHKNPNGSINFTVRGTYQYQKTGDLMVILQKLTLNDLWVSMRDGSKPEEIYETICFQPSTGQQFQLSALFAQGVNWRNDLLQPLQDIYTASCAGQNIPEDPTISDSLSKRLSRNVPYSLDATTLTIFLKNSSGNYTAISLPFEEIQSLIDTEEMCIRDRY